MSTPDQAGRATPDSSAQVSSRASCAASVARGRVRSARRLVEEVAAGDARGRIVARRQPRLREVTLAEIVAGVGAAHAGRHPAGLERVRQDVGPVPGDPEGQQHVEELAFRIGLGAVPAPPRPQQVVHRRVGATVQAGAEIDEPRRSAHQGREHVGCQDVDGEDMRQAVLGRDAPRFLVADPDVVDDRVERTVPVGLFGDAAHVAEARQVAHDDAGRAGRPRQRGLGPRAVATVEHDLVPFREEALPGHQAQPLRRTRDEDA